MKWWSEGLSHRDWLIDGWPITKTRLDMWNDLEWSKAWMDMGPSVAGNLGPYWHVPRKTEEDMVHRLYPRVLQGKWLNVIRRACEEATERAKK